MHTRPEWNTVKGATLVILGVISRDGGRRTHRTPCKELPWTTHVLLGLT